MAKEGEDDLCGGDEDHVVMVDSSDEEDLCDVVARADAHLRAQPPETLFWTLQQQVAHLESAHGLEFQASLRRLRDEKQAERRGRKGEARHA